MQKYLFKKFLHLLPGADDEEVVEKEVPVWAICLFFDRAKVKSDFF